jgi:hypothetical protein
MRVCVCVCACAYIYTQVYIGDSEEISQIYQGTLINWFWSIVHACTHNISTWVKLQKFKALQYFESNTNTYHKQGIK